MIALTKNERRRNRRRRQRQNLKFTPYAWAKLRFLRDLGPTEVGGFGISSTDDLLLVEDMQLVEQVCTMVSVEFGDNSVADFFDSQVDAGRSPEQFARIWIHTHPGASPVPSATDEETFKRCFDGADWAVMFILAEQGNQYARAQFNVGPGINRRLRCRQWFDCEFPAADHEAWTQEYCDNVTVYDPVALRGPVSESIESMAWWDRTAMPVDRWNDDQVETSQ